MSNVVSTELSFLNADELIALNRAARDELEFRVSESVKSICHKHGLPFDMFTQEWDLNVSKVDLSKFDVFSKVDLDRMGFKELSIHHTSGKYEYEQIYEMTGTIKEDVKPMDVFKALFLGAGAGKAYGFEFDVPNSEELGAAKIDGKETSLSFPVDMAFNDIKVTVSHFLQAADEEESITPVLRTMRAQYLKFNSFLDSVETTRNELAERLGVEIPADAVGFDRYPNPMFDPVAVEAPSFGATVSATNDKMIELKYTSQNLNAIDFRHAEKGRPLLFEDVLGPAIREMRLGNYGDKMDIVAGDATTFTAKFSGDKLKEFFSEGETELSNELYDVELSSELESEPTEMSELDGFLSVLFSAKKEVDDYLATLPEMFNSEMKTKYNIEGKLIKAMLEPFLVGDVGFHKYSGTASIKIKESIVDWYGRVSKIKSATSQDGIEFRAGQYSSRWESLSPEDGHYTIKKEISCLSRIRDLAGEFGVDLSGCPVLEKILKEEKERDESDDDGIKVNFDAIFYNTGIRDFELANDDGVTLSVHVKGSSDVFSYVDFDYKVRLPESHVDKYIKHMFKEGKYEFVFGDAETGLGVKAEHLEKGISNFSFDWSKPGEYTSKHFMDVVAALGVLSTQKKLEDYD
jgi:hypothetical protein